MATSMYPKPNERITSERVSSCYYEDLSCGFYLIKIPITLANARPKDIKVTELQAFLAAAKAASDEYLAE